MVHRYKTGIKAALSSLVLVLGMATQTARAQQDDASTYTIVMRQIPVEQALEELVALTQINLLYDPGLLTDALVYCNIRDKTAEAILRCITTEARLDFYRLSTGTYVLTEPPQDAPRFGTLSGVVVDEETGEALPYASVLLADASTGTAANNAGMFAFASLLAGPHEIVATYVGYEPTLDSVWVPPDGDVRRRIALRPKPIVSDPIVINGLQQRLPSQELGASAIDRFDIEHSNLTGTTDVVYSLNSIMSVGVRSPFVDLHVQGGESSENVMLLDGVPVFEPVSLGRMLGAFSPLAIGRITVYKAGFGAPIGSQLSGVLSAEHRLSASPRDHVALQIDPLSLNGRLNGSIELPGPASAQFMAAGRTSIWDVYESATLNNLLQNWNTVDPLLTSTVMGTGTDALQFTPHRHGSDVRFSDIHAATQVQLNAFQKLSLSFYRGKNEIGSELLTSESASSSAFIMLSRDRYDWTNAMTQARYEWLMGARALGTVRFRNSTHVLHHNYQMTDSESAALPDGLDVPAIERSLGQVLDTGLSPDDRNRLRETALEASVDYSVSRVHHLLAGIEIAQTSSRFSLDNPFFVPLELRFSDVRLSGYVEDRMSPSLKTTFEIGSRFTYVPDRGRVYAEPRVAFRYDENTSPIGAYAIHLAAGVYRQFINQFDLSNPGPSAAVPSIRFWLPIDESLAPPLAYHVSASLLVSPANGWSVRLESYYKDQPGIIALHYHPLLINGVIGQSDVTEKDFTERVDGYAFGGGIFVEREYRRGVTNIQYSYSEARRRFPARFDGRLETTPWNEPHRLTLANDFFFTPRFTTRLRMHGIWGRSWGFRQAYYDYLSAHAAPGQYEPFDLTHPSNDRLPAHYQIDAGVAYEHEMAGTAVQLRADVINLLGRRNVIDWSLRRGSESGILQKVERTLPGRAFAMSLRIRI